MKNHITNPFACLGRASRMAWLLPTLTIGLGWMRVGPLMAQTFTVLHSFSTVNQIYRTNSDGAYSVAGLLLTGNTLYGAAQFG